MGQPAACEAGRECLTAAVALSPPSGTNAVPERRIAATRRGAVGTARIDAIMPIIIRR